MLFITYVIIQFMRSNKLYFSSKKMLFTTFLICDSWCHINYTKDFIFILLTLEQTLYREIYMTKTEQVNQVKSPIPSRY